MAAAVEEGRLQPRGGREDFAEQRRETLIARSGKPLDLVFPRAFFETEQLRHGSIKPAERIGIVPFLFNLDLILACPPTRAAPKIAGVIQREDARLLKRRREKSRRRMGLVMLHYDDFGIRKLVPKRQMKYRFGPTHEGTHHRHTLHIRASSVRQA